jgi:hypothetical protein
VSFPSKSNPADVLLDLVDNADAHPERVGFTILDLVTMWRRSRVCQGRCICFISRCPSLPTAGDLVPIVGWLQGHAPRDAFAPENHKPDNTKCATACIFFIDRAIGVFHELKFSFSKRGHFIVSGEFLFVFFALCPFSMPPPAAGKKRPHQIWRQSPGIPHFTVTCPRMKNQSS